MRPDISAPTGVLYETDAEVAAKIIPEEIWKPTDRKLEVVWRSVIFMVVIHSLSLYALWLVVTSAKVLTTLFVIPMFFIGGLGVTAGAHRLWSHRAYKAKWPFRVILVFFNTMFFEDSIIDWARNHRAHHKFTDTDADPHNSNRGVFFSHIGWLMVRKHPMVKEKGSQIDISDLWADPILRFQKKYYLYLMPFATFILPALVPWYFWGETFKNAFIMNALRYTLCLHSTWLINSAAHKWGVRPYDKYISSSETRVTVTVSFGEGWHNYHHAFPWDYRNAELEVGKFGINVTRLFIDLFAMIGWAYDLKIVPPAMVQKRVERTGDGSHQIWGWGDKDLPKETYDEAVITHRKKRS